MKKNMFKKMGMGIATTMFAGSMFFAQTGVSEAALISKKVETDPQIKVLNNNVLVDTNIAPIIMEGTTYLPVRSLAAVFNKAVQWDGPNRSIFITDTVSPIEEVLRSQLIESDLIISKLQSEIKTKDSKISSLESASKTKDAKIAELEKVVKTKDAKIAELEKKLKSKTIDIDDLEDQLNDDYGNWKKLEIDISLKGDEDDIDVEIAIDVDDSGSYYDRLDDDDFEDLVDDIVNDIWDEFKKAEINGEIVDSSNKYKVLYDFYAEDGDIDFD